MKYSTAERRYPYKKMIQEKITGLKPLNQEATIFSDAMGRIYLLTDNPLIGVGKALVEVKIVRDN